MLRYHLEREGPEDDPRLREIHTYEEVVRPAWEDGVWRVTCATETAARALQTRHRFRLVETSEAPVPEPTPEQLAAARRKAHARSVADTPAEAPDAGASRPEEAWRAWRARHRTDIPERRNGWAAAEVLRAPVDAAALAALAEEAASPGKAPVTVAVVVVVTGWTDREEEAVLGALACCVELGSRARVVLVQNDPGAHDVTRAWSPPPKAKRLLRVLCIPNEGYAAGCRAGAAAFDRGAGWLLFTQADATFTASTVRQAVALAEAFPADVPPLVGPSGGRVVEIETGIVEEWGRNVRAGAQAPAAVDFVAGYWVLVGVEVYQRSGGWDTGYFLFHEDPDLAFRCALVGARAVAWPALLVEHRRGGTIKARFSRQVVEEMQLTSRERFVRVWGPRRAGGGAP